MNDLPVTMTPTPLRLPGRATAAPLEFGIRATTVAK